MKKLLAYSVLLICIGIYCLSSSEKITNAFAVYRCGTHAIWGSDKYTYGDLFGMSYLTEFKIHKTRDALIERKKYEDPKSIDLYELCDSYLWDFAASDTFYCGVNKFTYAKTNTLETMNVRLDSNKKNVFLFEFAERNILDLFRYRYPYFQSFLTNDPSKPEGVISSEGQSIAKILFDRNINTNIELNIWDTRLLTPLKEWKADLNYYLFKTVNSSVIVSPDSRYLLYSPTVDTFLNEKSSFANISNATVDTIVDKLNALYSMCRKMGFDEVYLSLIPNPVSVLYPNYHGYSYNNLIERIESSPQLKIPFIDVYTDFKKSPDQLYYNSDTHWNMNGCNTWLNRFNDTLNRLLK